MCDINIFVLKLHYIILNYLIMNVFGLTNLRNDHIINLLYVTLHFATSPYELLFLPNVFMIKFSQGQKQIQ